MTSLYCQNNAGYRKKVGESVETILSDAADVKVDIADIKDAIDAGFALTGDAEVGDVLLGQEFYKDDYRTKLTGTLELTGDVLVTDVATGKLFYSDDAKTILTGTATVVINKLALDDLIVAPVTGESPVETAIAIDQYTSGAITWFEADGTTPHAGAFGATTVYVAKATIVAETGYTLRGVDAGTFTHGDGTVTNTVDTGDVVITFNATGA